MLGSLGRGVGPDAGGARVEPGGCKEGEWHEALCADHESHSFHRVHSSKTFAFVAGS